MLRIEVRDRPPRLTRGDLKGRGCRGKTALDHHNLHRTWRDVERGQTLRVSLMDWDPLPRPSRNVDGRWTVDAWAPLDGRVINGGLRFQF